jgi:hypothetical protein
LPGALFAATRLRRAWPHTEGAIGLMLWVKPLSRRSGSLSVWESEAQLRRFIGSPRRLDAVLGHLHEQDGGPVAHAGARIGRLPGIGPGRDT